MGLVLCWLGLPLPAAMGIDPPGPPTVSLNSRVNDPLGPDGDDFPGGLSQCLNDPACDDDPKGQNETSISVAPWDRDLLVAAWNDFSPLSLDPAGELPGIGFAISDDGGATWLRFRRTLNRTDEGCGPLSCDPSDPDCPADLFVQGHSFNRDDLTFNPADPANPCFTFLGGFQADPGTSAGGWPGGDKYLYLVGFDAGPGTYFARLRWANPMTGWEVAHLFISSVGDTPKVTADPWSEDVYVYGAFGSGIWLAASRRAGLDFIYPNLTPALERRQIGYPPPLGGGLLRGPAGAVAFQGEFNIIWTQSRAVRDEFGESLGDQIRYRRGHWNANDELIFEPELPPEGSENCSDGNTWGEGVTCATPIIFGQPGMEAGFRGLSLIAQYLGTLVPRALNFRMTPFASIAVDRNDPTDLCGRGGTIYVAYPAEEPPVGDPDYRVCDTERTVDSNIYVVRGRVSAVDDTVTWSTPVQVPACPITACPAVVTCSDPDPLAPVPWRSSFTVAVLPLDRRG